MADRKRAQENPLPSSPEAMAAQIRNLERTVTMYERVFDLSRREMMDAYQTIEAHEAVENLSRDELITVKEEMKEIRHASNVRSKFFSSISHEIRTPLTLMISPLESMLQGELGDFTVEQHDYLKLMYDNSQRLLKLVNELLDFSKLESGKMRLFYQKTGFISVVRAILETFIPFAEKNRITFQTTLPEHEIELYIDAEKIEKVIINLVFNAFKFVSTMGRVTLEIKDKKDEVVFSVFNSGEGLPRDVLDKVFDRYAQFENYSAPHGTMTAGTGLGLALAKEFVDLHKGTIAMKNEKGKGVSCSFTLPKGMGHISKDLLAMGWGELDRRKDEQGQPTRELPTVGVSSLYTEIDGFYSLKKSELAAFEASIKRNAEQLYAADQDKKTVLVVEDNVEMRGFLRHVLSNYFVILDAENGEDGLRKALAQRPDLIISDVMMPVMDGYDMTRALKENEKTCRIPIILLTARAKNLNSMVEGLNIGADDYISKPFNIKELIARANALLRMRSLNDQLENTEGVIFSLANAVEAKDAYTEGHCFRLAEMSTEIARRLGMTAKEINSIRHGAILHDVGKIGIPEMILTKPGKLTEDERWIIRQHPVIGERICKPLRSTSSILPIIRSHHERYDGKGYPDGLAGEGIPVSARIVAIADSFDAMVFDRVYREGMGIEQARGIFRKERDSGQWDPRLVDIFLQIEEHWLEANMF